MANKNQQLIIQIQDMTDILDKNKEKEKYITNVSNGSRIKSQSLGRTSSSKSKQSKYHNNNTNIS